MVDLLILASVIAFPFFRTPVRITSPFGYICGFIAFMFIAKYCFNQWMQVSFLEGADPTELTTHFRAMAAYLGIAFILAMPFCHPYRRASPLPLANQILDTGFRLTGLAIFLLIALPILLVGLGLVLGLNPASNPLGFRQFIQSQGMFYILSVYIFLLGALSIYVPFVIFAERRSP
ncbi:MAG: hypothetical protein M3O06_04850, partial [Pseudomonadota bacterium]|nr:hypothetical protein [Pseudomonadota bacterium]